MSVEFNESELVSSPAVESRSGETIVSLRRVVLPLALLVLVSASLVLISSHPQTAVWDQAQLLEARFDSRNFPSPALGFTSQLVVALQASLSPITSMAQNEQVRALAMCFYAVSATLLASVLIRRVALQLLFVCFVFSSQYPFLWLSSELVVGGFLCLTLFCWAIRAPLWLTATTAALLALCKPDLILLSGVLMVFMAREQRDRRDAGILLGSFALGIAVLLLPGLVLMGWEYFDTYTESSGGRSLQSFKQHFAALVANFQVFSRGPNPWTDSHAYFEPFFPGAASLLDVVWSRPAVYLDFVAMAVVRGILRAGWVLNYALLALPFLYWGRRRLGCESARIESLLRFSFVGFIPFVTLAYPHIRYMARFYPIAMLLIVMALERVLAAERSPLRTAALAGAGASLLFSLALNLQRLSASLLGLPEMSQYWFPD